MPHRLISRRFRERLGRRGVILSLFGLMWLLMGIAYLAVPELSAGQGAETDAAFWHERLPAFATAALWGVSGGIALVYGIIHKDRNDTKGFLAVTAPPMVLATSFLVGVFTRLLIGDGSGAMLGVIGFVIYGLFALALGVIASWPDSEGE